MSDSISTLALRVDSQGALAKLNEFGFAADNLGKTVGMLRGRMLELNAAFLSAGFAKGLIREAAEGQEVLGKFEQVLGAFTGRANKLVSELRTNFSYDATSAQAAIAGMVDTLKKAGMETSDALANTDALLKRASDIAAFTNRDINEVTSALTSGMLGITQPLKRLGIVMNETALDAAAMEEGLEGVGKKGDRLSTMQARLSVILKQTATAEGQVARESDNHASKVRKLQAVVADFRNELGDEIIPVATSLVSAGTRVMQALESLSPAAKRAIVVTGALIGATVALGKPIATAYLGLRQLAAANVITGKATRVEAQETATQTAAETANTAASQGTVAAKNLEAAARTRNAAAIHAENAALNAGTFSHHKIGGLGKPSALGKKALSSSELVSGATFGKGAKGALGKGAQGALGAFGKGAKGVLGKIAGVFESVFGKVLKYVPIASRFGGVLAKALGLFSTGAAVIGAVIGALQILKKAPEWLEAFIQDGWPKIKDFISSMPPKIYEGLKDIGVKIGGWIKDLTIGALVGLGSLVSRLFGNETAFSQQYKLDKQIEEANARREKLLATEEAQRNAEIKVLESINDAKKAQLAANAKYAASKNDDQTKLAAAEADLGAKENEYAQKEAEQNKLQADMAKVGAAQEKINNARRQIATAKKDELSNATSSDERYAITKKYQELDARLDQQQEKLDTKRAELEENSGKLAESMGKLSEEIVQQRASVDELAEKAADEAKSALEDQKAFAESQSDAQKSLLAQARAEKLATAKTHAERLEALQAQLDAADEAVNEAEEARGVAAQKNDQIQNLNASLNDGSVAKNLAVLSQLATSGATDVSAGKQYAEAVQALKAAGYDVSASDSEMKEGSALTLLESVNNQRGLMRDRLETLTDERNKANETAGELSSRKAEQLSARQALEGENKTFSDSKREANKEEGARYRERVKLSESRQKAYDDELYNRQLTAIESNIDERDPWGQFNAAVMKSSLVASRGEYEWSAAQEKLGGLKSEIDLANGEIETLESKRDSGTATEDDLRRLSEAEERRDRLQSEYDSKYDAALSARWATEKELFGLQKEMGSEQDKQLRNYVSEQGSALKNRLEEEARAAEEENQKRLAERSEVEKEQRQAVSGAKAISAGSSEAFQIQSKIYDRGQVDMPPEKKIEKSTEKIEKYVSQLQEQLYQYLSGNNPITISMGY